MVLLSKLPFIRPTSDPLYDLATVSVSEHSPSKRNVGLEVRLQNPTWRVLCWNTGLIICRHAEACRCSHQSLQESHTSLDQDHFLTNPLCFIIQRAVSVHKASPNKVLKVPHEEKWKIVRHSCYALCSLGIDGVCIYKKRT
jgi:hypothetical protein